MGSIADEVWRGINLLERRRATGDKQKNMQIDESK